MTNLIKQIIQKIPGSKTFISYLVLLNPKTELCKKVILLRDFINDYKKYKKNNLNNKFIFSKEYLKPCLFDKTNNTPIEAVYFFQDTWCAKKIFNNKPAKHVDIGSQAELVGIISQFTPTVFVDIRPIELELPNLSFVKGDILSLPFENNTLESISSICVIEHIGLGRYDDRLDSMGSEKAIMEIKRVLATNGNLYISLPIDSDNIIYFNAHRAFTRNYILELFNPLVLKEEKYHYKNEKKLFDNYDRARGFGTGLFHFIKQ